MPGTQGYESRLLYALEMCASAAQEAVIAHVLSPPQPVPTSEEKKKKKKKILHQASTPLIGGPSWSGR